MRYVILRDDDTNAFTPAECLEQLYRPFLDRNLPVNLATIPCVRRNARTPSGEPEGFLFGVNGAKDDTEPLWRNQELVDYLRRESLYKVIQHGCCHDTFEFDLGDKSEIARRLDAGANHLSASGLKVSSVFVAPHDRISRPSYVAIRRRFNVVSTGWFELRRLPRRWWPIYLWRKITKRPHWRVGKTILLSHPGCLLSRHRPYDQILNNVRSAIKSSTLTVLVTHWWEYFPNQEPDRDLIAILHQTAGLLANDSTVRVISFGDLQELPDAVQTR